MCGLGWGTPNMEATPGWWAAWVLLAPRASQWRLGDGARAPGWPAITRVVGSTHTLCFVQINFLTFFFPNLCNRFFSLCKPGIPSVLPVLSFYLNRIRLAYSSALSLHGRKSQSSAPADADGAGGRQEGGRAGVPVGAGAGGAGWPPRTGGVPGRGITRAEGFREPEPAAVPCLLDTPLGFSAATEGGEAQSRCDHNMQGGQAPGTACGAVSGRVLLGTGPGPRVSGGGPGAPVRGIGSPKVCSPRPRLGSFSSRMTRCPSRLAMGAPKSRGSCSPL